MWRRVRRVWITLGLGATAIFTVWSLVAYRAAPAARYALRGNSAVSVIHHPGWFAFAPAAPLSGVGLLLVPGSLVDPTAYAPLVRAAAERGFPAVIVELPLRGAFGAARGPELRERIRVAMNAPGAPERWVLAGHSLGGVIATNLAAEELDQIVGLVLIGTSHPRDRSLAALTIPVSKIVGTRDGLASPGEVRANAHLLPAATRWIWVEGGNHSQFGWYGFQPGDRRAKISAKRQHDLLMAAVLSALETANAPVRALSSVSPDAANREGP